MIYGNPSKEHVNRIEHSIVLQQWKDHLRPLLALPYPCDVTTRHELVTLVRRQEACTPEEIMYANIIDEQLLDTWEEYIASFGYTVPVAQLDRWIRPLTPIIDYFKVQYNRPRPFQLAGLWNIPLYPTVRYGSTSASYPSGHTLQSLFIYHHLVELYPRETRQWLQMVCDVADTRLDLGVHYPSDNLVSFQIYQHLRPIITTYHTGHFTGGVDIRANTEYV